MDLFALLRAGVRSGDTPDIGGSTDDRWRELYTAASSQGVSALVWDGIRRLPPGVAAVEGASVALGLQRRADRTPVRAAASPGSGTGCGLRRSGNSYRRIERARRQPVVPCSGTSALRRSGLFPLRRLRARQSGGRTGRGRGETRFLQTLPYRIPRADGRKPPVLYGGSREPSGEAVRAASSTIACGGTVVLHTGNGAARPSAPISMPFFWPNTPCRIS